LNGEVAALIERPEDGIHLAHHQLEHVDLVVQHAQKLLFDGAFLVEIENEDIPALTDAVHAAHALFDAQGIPRQVEVDDGIGELEIAPFAARSGREQHTRLVAEQGDGGILFRAGEVAAEERIGDAVRLWAAAGLPLHQVERQRRRPPSLGPAPLEYLLTALLACGLRHRSWRSPVFTIIGVSRISSLWPQLVGSRRPGAWSPAIASRSSPGVCGWGRCGERASGRFYAWLPWNYGRVRGPSYGSKSKYARLFPAL
jgi:hypothetical protein